MKSIFKSTQEFTFMALMLALTILFNFLGLLPTLSASAAYLIFLPTILTGVLYGPRNGAIMGGLAGLVTLLRALFAPLSALDPLFINPLLSVLPRIFIGVTPWLLYKPLSKLIKNKVTLNVVGGAVAGAIGAITNTVLVLTMLYLLYADVVVNTLGISFQVLLGIIITSSALLEAGISALLMAIILPIVSRIKKA